jgi:hypothetical protein
MIVLDTDVMIDLLRQYQPALDWLQSLGEEKIVLPGFVVMELIQGCRNSAEQEKLWVQLRIYEVAWPSPQVCDEALSVFRSHHLREGLGILDALIGQMAVALNLPLYTFNQRHYAAIANLKTVQPYEKGLQK